MNAEAQVRYLQDLVARLHQTMVEWAADEDGVPDDYYGVFEEAGLARGGIKVSMGLMMARENLIACVGRYVDAGDDRALVKQMWLDLLPDYYAGVQSATKAGDGATS